jgi:hypothetical protein
VLYDSIILFFLEMCNLYSVFVFRLCGLDTDKIDDCDSRRCVSQCAKVFEIYTVVSITDLRKNELKSLVALH